VALLTHVFTQPGGFYLGVTFVAQSSALVLDEPKICQLLVTHLTGKTFRVPSGLHGLDDPSDDELAALGAARSEQDVEVMFAVLPSFELIEHSIWERSEALRTYEAAGVKKFAVGVHYFGFWFKPIVAACAGDALQVHDSWHGPSGGGLVPLRSLQYVQVAHRCGKRLS